MPIGDKVKAYQEQKAALAAQDAAGDRALSTDPTPVPTYEHASEAQVAAAPMGVTPELLTVLFEKLGAVLATNKDADMQSAATLHALAMKKALRPENEISPMISVYNPKGETAYPRPKPTHEYLMGPYPIASPQNYDTATWTEIELLNQLEPGTYQVTKADGTDVKLTVRTLFDASGKKPVQTTLIMPIADDEQKAGWPPLVQLLTQVITGEAPMQSFTRLTSIIADKDSRIRDLEAQLAALQAT